MQVAALLAAPGDPTPRIDIAWNTNLAYLQADTWSEHRCRPVAMRDTDIGWETKIVAATGGQVATFTGCVYNQTGNKYQAVRISLNQSATVTFDANLYYGTSCNPNQWADEFGFGQNLSLSSASSYIFWFRDFQNQITCRLCGRSTTRPPSASIT